MVTSAAGVQMCAGAGGKRAPGVGGGAEAASFAAGVVASGRRGRGAYVE